jgi:hypothetical protein
VITSRSGCKPVLGKKRLTHDHVHSVDQPFFSAILSQFFEIGIRVMSHWHRLSNIFALQSGYEKEPRLFTVSGLSGLVASGIARFANPDLFSIAAANEIHHSSAKGARKWVFGVLPVSREKAGLSLVFTTLGLISILSTVITQVANIATRIRVVTFINLSIRAGTTKLKSAVTAR